MREGEGVGIRCGRTTNKIPGPKLSIACDRDWPSSWRSGTGGVCVPMRCDGHSESPTADLGRYVRSMQV